MPEKEKIYSYAKLFEILSKREEQSPVLERKAIPFLIKNISDNVIKYDYLHNEENLKGEVAPGEYFVVQPSGAYHKTSRHLHGDIVTADKIDTTGLSITNDKQVDAAVKALLENNKNIDLKIGDLELAGLGPSISKTQAYRIPEELHGAFIDQPWGKQQIDTKNQVLVKVLQKEPDCYANASIDMKDWYSKEKNLSGTKLVESLLVLTVEELKPALSMLNKVGTKDSGLSLGSKKSDKQN